MENIFSIFGCPCKIVTDNAQAFKLENMIEFCNNNNVTLSHSIAYYPQGNDWQSPQIRVWSE